MNGLTNLKTDLMCVFGFSKSNAEEAITRLLQDKLSLPEASAMQYLADKDPFKIQQVAPNKLKPMDRKAIGFEDMLTNLNYRISNGS